DADEATRVAAAVAAATALGWLVFGPHLAHVLNLPEREQFDAQVGAAVRRAVGFGARASNSRSGRQKR
ncbi:MAG: hypothetical protein QOI15_763, partial [Pseudonocardiales bacterium]|nr:hypothetical protein [Pseudonocardiales bacterium]